MLCFAIQWQVCYVAPGFINTKARENAKVRRAGTFACACDQLQPPAGAGCFTAVHLAHSLYLPTPAPANTLSHVALTRTPSHTVDVRADNWRPLGQLVLGARARDGGTPGKGSACGHVSVRCAALLRGAAWPRPQAACWPACLRLLS